MRCTMQKQIIADWVIGNLSDEEVRRVEKHLTECTQCATTAEQLQQGMRVLAEKATDPLPLGLKQRIMSHAQEKRSHRTGSWFIWRLTMTATIAALLTVVSVTLFTPKQQWTEQQLYQAYSEDFEELGLLASESSSITESENGQLFGVPTDLVSYLN